MVIQHEAHEDVENEGRQPFSGLLSTTVTQTNLLCEKGLYTQRRKSEQEWEKRTFTHQSGFSHCACVHGKHNECTLYVIHRVYIQGKHAIADILICLSKTQDLGPFNSTCVFFLPLLLISKCLEQWLLFIATVDLFTTDLSEQEKSTDNLITWMPVSRDAQHQEMFWSS